MRHQDALIILLILVIGLFNLYKQFGCNDDNQSLKSDGDIVKYLQNENVSTETLFHIFVNREQQYSSYYHLHLHDLDNLRNGTIIYRKKQKQILYEQISEIMDCCECCPFFCVCFVSNIKL